MKAPDSYKKIKDYSTSLNDVLKTSIKRGIHAADPENDVFAVLMHKDRINDLLSIEGCVYLAATIGIHYDQASTTDPKIPTNVTVSLLGADNNKKILDAHRLGGVPGQEVWPDKIIFRDINIFLP